MARIVMPSPNLRPVCKPIDELLSDALLIAQEQLKIYGDAARQGAPFDRELMQAYCAVVELLFKFKAKEKDIDLEALTDDELRQLITDMSSLLSDRQT